MSERTRLGLSVLGAGIALGVAGDLLLRETPWGLNWVLWAALFAVGAAAAGRLGGADEPRHWPWLGGLALLFSAGLAWRASPVLGVLNLAAAGAAAALAAGALRAGVSSYAASAGLLAAETIGGPFPAATDVRWSELPRGRLSGHAGAAARGFALAVPLLFLFGGLFFAADAVFEDLVRSTFDVEDLYVHLLVIGLWTWVASGVLHHVLTRRDPVETPVKRRLGAVEIGVVLGTLIALFLVFVLVQLRYLFGGGDHVVETTGLTYAEYARRGFFELVTVAALALPLVLAGDALARSRRLFRALTLVLVLLLAVVMLSAVERMRLYTDAYGLTQLRLYTLAFMLWLAAVLAWMLATVLRDRHRWFMPGAFAAGLAAVLVLNVVNPDALIARTNLDRYADGKRLDSWYLTTLSTDATPVVLDRLDELPRNEREFLFHNLPGGSEGWRTWNWSRARAQAALDAHESSALAAKR